MSVIKDYSIPSLLCDFYKVGHKDQYVKAQLKSIQLGLLVQINTFHELIELYYLAYRGLLKNI